MDLMTRRTDHIRATALKLAAAGELSARSLADAVHVTDGQARRWLRLLREEGRIEVDRDDATGTTGPPRRYFRRTW
jgi:predicted ArsR family transcriptional regulator